MANLTLAEIRSDVAALRFNDSADTGRLNRWINVAYAELWAADSWVFRQATSNPTTTIGSRTLAGTPTVGFIAKALWDDGGNRIPYLTPHEFYDLYAGDTTTGAPCCYTVVNQSVQVAPTPASAVTWTMLRERRITQLISDDDTPNLIPAEFQYLLVPGAIVWGQMLRGDDTADLCQERLDRGLEAMRREYLADTRGEPIVWPSNEYADAYG